MSTKNTQYLKNINDRLKKIFTDEQYVKFKLLLENNNAVISGSFIIQCILNEIWEDSDIDIFVKKNTHEFLYESDDVNYKKFCLETFFCKCGFTFIKEDKNKSNYFYNLKYVVEIQTFIKDKNKIQIIFINENSEKSLENYIFENFDFSICKNTYSIKNKTEILNIYDLNGILYKKFDFGFTSNNKKSMERYENYSQREFNKNKNNDFVIKNDKIKDMIELLHEVKNIFILKNKN
jgi:hypothetical protein